MPMIDVYATEGTFNDKHMLAQNLAKAVMRWEKVPQIPLFLDNTAAFIHDLTGDAIANAAGDPSLAGRTWVLITESPEGGWGMEGHANTSADIVASARAALQGKR
jgi:phenylpyruvate tautomerase PptA (4-oxalocrotonate tautomerase family)